MCQIEYVSNGTHTGLNAKYQHYCFHTRDNVSSFTSRMNKYMLLKTWSNLYQYLRQVIVNSVILLLSSSALWWGLQEYYHCIPCRL